MPGPLLVVDAPLLLYRSFFGIPESVKGVEDHPVNALLGSVNALLRAVAETKPRTVVICFGAEQAPYRVELYAGYHAQRPPMPEDLAWQFQQAPALFSALGWGVATSVELEADDLLGSYALIEADAGGETLILTGDRDLYQCASPQTLVLYLKQGSGGFDRIDPEEVVDRYGVLPEQVPDFIALRGDPSDGLPGAPGIGQKTAAELLLGSDPGSRPPCATTPSNCAPSARSRCCSRSRSNARRMLGPTSRQAPWLPPRLAWVPLPDGSRPLLRRVVAEPPEVTPRAVAPGLGRTLRNSGDCWSVTKTRAGTAAAGITRRQALRRRSSAPCGGDHRGKMDIPAAFPTIPPLASRNMEALEFSTPGGLTTGVVL
jgi:hypothetical protein